MAGRLSKVVRHANEMLIQLRLLFRLVIRILFEFVAQPRRNFLQRIWQRRATPPPPRHRPRLLSSGAPGEGPGEGPPRYCGGNRGPILPLLPTLSATANQIDGIFLPSHFHFPFHPIGCIQCFHLPAMGWNEYRNGESVGVVPSDWQRCGELPSHSAAIWQRRPLP